MGCFYNLARFGVSASGFLSKRGHAGARRRSWLAPGSAKSCVFRVHGHTCTGRLMGRYDTGLISFIMLVITMFCYPNL